MTTSEGLRSSAATIALVLAACGGSNATPTNTAAPTTAAPSAPSDPSVATIMVIGRDLDDAELWIDGERSGPFVTGTEVRVTPGEHLFEARRDGAVLGSTHARAGAGQTGLAMIDRIADPALREPPAPEPPRLPGHVELPTTVRESGDGEFDPAVVVRAIAAREHAFDDCYEHARGQSPDVGGPLTLLMIVEESGDVIPTEIASGTIGDAGNECVRGVIEGIRFNPGPLDDQMIYELTLRFAPDA